MYTVENIQDKNTWVVKDTSNKVVVCFCGDAICNAAKEAENYAQRLNEAVDKGKYSTISSALNRVYDKAAKIQEIISIIHDKMGDTDYKDTVEHMLDLIPESATEFEQALAALPSKKDFNELLAITAKTHIGLLRGY